MPHPSSLGATNGPARPGRRSSHPPIDALYNHGIWPGLFLTTAIAGLAFGLREIPGVETFSPMILAIVIGMAFHNIVGTPKRGRKA